MEANKYDCPITPGMRRCKVFIDTPQPLNLNWEKYFEKIEKHPDNTYILINTGECYIMILTTGYVDILQAKDDEVIDKYVNIIEQVVKDGVPQ